MNGDATIFFTLIINQHLSISCRVWLGIPYGVKLIFRTTSESYPMTPIFSTISSFISYYLGLFGSFGLPTLIIPVYACSFPRPSIYILAFYLSPPVGRFSAHDDLSNILSRGAPLFYGRSPTTKSSFTFNSRWCT